MISINRKRDRISYENSNYDPKSILFDSSLIEDRDENGFIKSLSQDINYIDSVNNSQDLENLIKAQLKSTRTTIRKVEELVKRRQSVKDSSSLKNKNYFQTYIPPVFGCPDITPSYMPNFSDDELSVDKELVEPQQKRQKRHETTYKSSVSTESIPRRIFGYFGSLFSLPKPSSLISPHNLIKNNHLYLYFTSEKKPIDQLEDTKELVTKSSINSFSNTNASEGNDNNSVTSVESTVESDLDENEEESEDDLNNKFLIPNTIYPRTNLCEVSNDEYENDESDIVNMSQELYRTPTNVQLSANSTDLTTDSKHDLKLTDTSNDTTIMIESKIESSEASKSDLVTENDDKILLQTDVNDAESLGNVYCENQTVFNIT